MSDPHKTHKPLKKPSLEELKQYSNDGTKPATIAPDFVSLDNTRNSKTNSPQNSHNLYVTIVIVLVLLVSLGVNFISLRQIQTLTTQNQDNTTVLNNLSKRLGLTENEIQDLNKPAVSPDEIVQKALKSVVVIEKRLDAQTVSDIRNYTRDQYVSRIEDKDALNQAAPAKELWEQLGSGVVLSSDGAIVTNKHIVATNGQYRIRTIDDQTYPIQRTMLHPYEDLAIIQAADQNTGDSGNKDLGLVPIQIETTQPQTGDEIYALGHPAKLSFSVTKGIVSNPNRNFTAAVDDYLNNLKLPEILRRAYFNNSGQEALLPLFLNSDLSQASVLQHSAPINLGSSGGAIINTQGKLVGINTFGIQREDSETYNLIPNLENPYQAIDALDQIQNKIVQGYTPGSDFNSNGAIKAEVVAKIWQQYQAATKNNSKFEVAYLGFYVASFTQTQAALLGYPINYGVQISHPVDKVYNYDLPAIDPNGPAKDSGLKEGDILNSVDGMNLDINNDLGKILATKKPSDTVKLGYYRLGGDKKWVKNEINITLGALAAWNDDSLKDLTLGNISL